MSADERVPESSAPAMYMLWPHGHPMPSIPSIPVAYSLFTIVNEETDKARHVIEIDGPLSAILSGGGSATQSYRTGCLSFRNAPPPPGLAPSALSIIRWQPATISRAADRLGYLVVAPRHRRRGLGAALIITALRRLQQGGYRHIFLGVQSWRLPAICSYLRVGFQPFIHAPELVPRWESVFAALGRRANKTEWPTKLAAPPAPIDLL